MANDIAEQLDACRQQSIRDEDRIADLERQNAELEHDLTRAESALADRMQHDAHTHPTVRHLDRGALRELLRADDPIRRAYPSPDERHRLADRILALTQPVDGVLITPEEAQLAIRAARHSAESIRAVLDVDPTRLHPDVAPYVGRLTDLADRLQEHT